MLVHAGASFNYSATFHHTHTESKQQLVYRQWSITLHNLTIPQYITTAYYTDTYTHSAQYSESNWHKDSNVTIITSYSFRTSSTIKSFRYREESRQRTLTAVSQGIFYTKQYDSTALYYHHIDIFLMDNNRNLRQSLVLEVLLRTTLI